MITTKEADILSAMMFVFAHATEQAAHWLEQYYLQETESSDYYQQLLRARTQQLIQGGVPPRFALERAKRECHEDVERMNKESFMSDNALRFKEWKEATEKFHMAMDRFTTEGIGARKDEKTEWWKMAQALQSDANIMCELFCYYSNIPEANMLSMRSSLMALGTQKRVDTDMVKKYFTLK